MVNNAQNTPKNAPLHIFGEVIFPRHTHIEKGNLSPCPPRPLRLLLTLRFRPHRLQAVHRMRPIATNVARLSVCLYVGHMGELCKNGWTDHDSVWQADSRGSKEPRIISGSRSDASIRIQAKSDYTAMRPFAKILWTLSDVATPDLCKDGWEELVE